jgi:hypothetical protein
MDADVCFDEKQRRFALSPCAGMVRRSVPEYPDYRNPDETQWNPGKLQLRPPGFHCVSSGLHQEYPEYQYFFVMLKYALFREALIKPDNHTGDTHYDRHTF